LDLGEVTLVNRAVVDFLRRVEARHALETGTEVTNDRARAN